MCKAGLGSPNDIRTYDSKKEAVKIGKTCIAEFCSDLILLQTGILGSGSFGIVIRAVDETAVPKHEVLSDSLFHCYIEA